MAALKQFPLVYIEKHEHYQKGSYRNRALLTTAQGVTELSIPLLKGKNNQQPIYETAISWHENWAKRHWQSIQTAYGKAPFFEFYADELKDVFFTKHDLLLDFNKAVLDTMIDFLGISTSIEWTESYVEKNNTDYLDFRNVFDIKTDKKDISDAHAKGVVYLQVFEEKQGFIPKLSILDLIFCTGPESVSYLNKEWELLERSKVKNEK